MRRHKGIVFASQVEDSEIISYLLERNVIERVTQETAYSGSFSPERANRRCQNSAARIAKKNDCDIAFCLSQDNVDGLSKTYGFYRFTP